MLFVHFQPRSNNGFDLFGEEGLFEHHEYTVTKAHTVINRTLVLNRSQSKLLWK